jgi:hypothetical protein
MAGVEELLEVNGQTFRRLSLPAIMRNGCQDDWREYGEARWRGKQNRAVKGGGSDPWPHYSVQGHAYLRLLNNCRQMKYRSLMRLRSTRCEIRSSTVRVRQQIFSYSSRASRQNPGGVACRRSIQTTLIAAIARVKYCTFSAQSI